MFGSLQGIMPMLLQNMQQNNNTAYPGQESRALPNMQGLQDQIAGTQQRSGAVGLPQQQQQMQQQPHPIFGGSLPALQQAPGIIPIDAQYSVLPPLNDGPDGFDMGSTTPIGMEDPMSWNMNPQQQQTSFQGGPQQQQQQQQGPIDPVSGQPTGKQQGADWSKLLSPFGTMTNPNALVRAGVGYNQGGLLGALGYLLTDMSRENNQF